MNYGYELADEAHWPAVTGGLYKFVDRHSGADDKSNDASILNRSSFNFSVAVYDPDTATLYYFEFDT